MDQQVGIGDTVRYAIEIHNQGNITADSIEVYDSIPSGLGYVVEAGAGWSDGGVALVGGENSLVIDTVYAPMGGLMPGEVDTLFVSLRVLPDATDSTLTNRAQIGVTTNTNGDTLIDNDSPSDAIFGNDGGGVAEGESDDEILGNGTAAPGDDSSVGDEDDEDPAVVFLDVFDLALTKVVTDPSSHLVGFGDTVTYTITIYNQGNVVADSVQVFDSIPGGLGFISALNPGWSGAMDGDSAVVIDTLIGFAMGLQPDSTFTIDVQLQVLGNATNASLINRAEIGVALNSLGDTLIDIDSEGDNDFTNDGGGVAGTDSLGSGSLTDNVITGDGLDPNSTPRVDDPGLDEDDEDPAPVFLDVFDLALRKALSAGQEVLVAPGDTVSFDIVVINQGAIPADTIYVSDSLPAGLFFDMTLNPGWVGMDMLDMQVVDTVIGETLNPGDSLVVPIQLIVGTGSTGAEFVNRAEISLALNEVGDTLIDVDSEADRDFTNDRGGVPEGTTDDVTGGDALDPAGVGADNDDPNFDEDDSDPALVRLDTFDLALRKVVIDPMDQQVGIGDTVRYAIEIHNQGNITADSIEVYDSIPSGLGYVVEAGAGWSDGGVALVGGENSLVIDTVYAPMGGLMPGEVDTLFVSLRVLPDATDSTLTNRAQIGVTTNTNGDTLIDNDSPSDAIFGNDGGGVAEGESDDEILGNGTAAPGDDSSVGDEDDEDPAVVFLDVFDLALTKVVTDPSSHLVGFGDTVTYTITIYNQGNVVADSVQVFDSIPGGLGFISALNPGWSGAMDGDSAVVIDTLIGFAMGLQPDSTFTIDVQLQVLGNATNASLINRAEIGVALNSLGDTLIDIDSEGDNDFTNDGGGVAGTDSLGSGSLTDNVITGDGLDPNSTPRVDDPGLDEDDEDPAPVFLDVFDLALRKALSAGQEILVAPGDTVSFDIVVINQGAIPADTIYVSDSLPAGLFFDMTLNPGWVGMDMLDMQVVDTVIGETLNPGDSLVVPIQLIVGTGSTGAEFVNRAEISLALNEVGDTLIDVDSEADRDFTNDRGGVPEGTTDDVTGGDALDPAGVGADNDDPNFDEDDSDPALVRLDTFDLALRKVVIDPMDQQVGIGDTVRYAIEIHNQGNITADSIEVYDSIPSGLGYVVEAGAGWSDGGVALVGGENSLVIDTVYAPMGGLMPGEVDTLFVSLRVLPDATDSTLTNRAQIGVTTNTNGDTLIDNDSPSDAIFGNDGGGVAEGESDDEILGNGTAAPGDDSSVGDEDDEDPAVVFLDVFDLALTKVVTDPSSHLVGFGDTVTYTITIYNQGNVVADSVQVFDSIPGGLGFISALNPGWSGAMDGDSAVVIDTLIGFAMGLQPDSTFTIDVQLQVLGNATNASLINRAEIGVALNSLGDTLIDIDSEGDNDFTNDGGGVAGTDSLGSGSLTDNVITGDGLDPNSTPRVDDPGLDEDDEDPAPVFLDVFDLALRKALSAGQEVLVAPGDTVRFDIVVINQGAIPADTIYVSDSLPAGLFFDMTLNPGWVGMDMLDMQVVDTVIGETLNPGDSLVVPIQLIVGTGSTGAEFVNRAEISLALNEVGDTLIDVDSEADRDFTNDRGGVPEGTTDDVTGGDALDPAGVGADNDDPNFDEDDSDPALVRLDTFDLALRKVVIDPMDQQVGIGDTVRYAIEIHNQGNITADSIEVYDSIPSGLGYVVEAGAGWSDGGVALVGGENSLVIDTVYAPMGGLMPGEVDTLFVSLRVLPDATDSTLTNRAQIGVTTNTNGDTLIDNDSPSDAIFGNDGGGVAEGESDDEILGNGTAAPGDDSSVGDEDDEDPAVVFLDVFDLALTKVVTDPSSHLVGFGDTVTYTITIYNQGNVVADSVQVFDSIPGGLGFISALNPGWSGAMDGDSAVVIDTLIGFAMGLQPDSTFTIDVQLQVLGNATNASLINRAEIGVALNSLGDTLIDIDSEGDNDFTNDGGGVAGTDSLGSGSLTDNVITGDGLDPNSTPRVDDPGLDEDDEDPAPVFLDVFDLALRKALSAGQEILVAPGDTVSFDIVVINQGAIPADTIYVSDSLPAGLFFDMTLNPGWVGMDMLDMQVVDTVIGETLNPGDSLVVPIQLIVGTGSTGAEFVNRAEISLALNEVGDTLIDVDSEADRDFTNDRGGVPEGTTDDVTGGNAKDPAAVGADEDDPNFDEDDSDPALVRIDTFDLALVKVVTDPSSSLVGIGDTVCYDIILTNQGNIAADSVQIFDTIPAGLGYLDIPENGGWSGAVDGQSEVIIDTVLAFPMGFAMGDIDTISLKLRVLPGATNATLVNYSEIGIATNQNGDTLIDIDSDGDNVFTNDGGGQPGTDSLGTGSNTDNVTSGDGTGAFGSDDPGTDEDDHDPAPVFLDAFDLALRKTLAADEDVLVAPGDTVTFDIVVINQGLVDADSIVVLDSVPAGLEFSSAINPGWMGIDGSEVVVEFGISGGLVAGDSTSIPIELIVGTGATNTEFVNRAEIGLALNSEGDTLVDIDSDADRDFTNDRGGVPEGVTDDVTGGNAKDPAAVGADEDDPNFDEDDSDPALVRIDTFDLALVKVVTDPSSSLVGIGDTVCYDIILTNQGNIAADSVQIFDTIPAGLGYLDIPENGGWSGAVDGQSEVIIDTVLAFPMGFAMGDIDTISLKLRVLPGATNATLVNYSEIGIATNQNGDTLIDIDSDGDNVFTNDGGGQPGTDSLGTGSNTDNVTSGDGTGAFGSDDPGTDEDDHDPAPVFLDAFDLALRKTLAADEDVLVAPGDTVTFDIVVINQGLVDADSIVVLDSVPAGLEFSSAINPGWMGIDGSEVVVEFGISGGLVAGDSTSIPIELIVGTGATNTEFVNRAEIGLALNSEGDTLVDIDSDADRDFTNDRGGVPEGVTDDVTGGNAKDPAAVGADEDDPNFDEDDSDPALVRIDTFDLALVKVVTDPSSSLVGIGDTVCYDIILTNQGNIAADSVQIFDTIPAGLGYLDIPENGGWSGAVDGQSEVIIDTVLAFPMGFAMGDIDTISLKLRVLPGATNATLVNYSEIGIATNQNGDTLIDIDSEGDNIFTNDGGGQPGTDSLGTGSNTDNVTSGDGTGAFGSDDPGTDEDDHDPAPVFLDAFDLALVKTTLTDQEIFRIGDTVGFKISVINQGLVVADTIGVRDSFPSGFMFDASNTGWTLVGGGTYESILAPAGGLMPGDTICDTISLVIADTMLVPGPDENDLIELTNLAEITFALNNAGDTLEDIDSRGDIIFGNDGGGNPGTDSDDVTSGDGTGMPGSTDANEDEDDQDPESIFVEVPILGLAKRVSNIVPNEDATFNITYVIEVENLGNVVLDSVQVVDSLDIFLDDKAGVDTFFVVRIESDALTENDMYTGRDPDYNLLQGTDELDVDEQATIEIEYVVEPGRAIDSIFMNTAYAEAISPLGDTVMDQSQDGPDTDPNDDLDPIENDTTMFTLSEFASIGVAKRVVFTDIFQDPNDGSSKFRAQFEINVQNYGNVGIDSVQVTDNLANVFFPCDIDTIQLTSDDFKVNENYDGETDTLLLTGNDYLGFVDKGAILVTVILEPCDSVGPFFNTAIASGFTINSTSVRDSSQEGSDPDPDGDGDPTNNNEPTEVIFDEEPRIGISKNISEGPENNGDGTYDLTFEIRVENRGNVNIDSFQLIDDLQETFMDMCQVEILGVESDEFQVNYIGADPSNGGNPTGYDGILDSALLLPGQVLKAWDEGAVYLRLRVGPCDTLDGFENSAVGMGISMITGEMVIDSSNNGTDPDLDDDGITNEPSDNIPTPIMFEEEAIVGIAKRLVEGPTLAEEGGYLVTFEFNIQNYGTVTIDSLQVTDDLSTTFPAPCVVEKVVITSGDYKVNENFDGVTDMNLLLGIDSLLLDDKGSINLTIRVDSCADAGPFFNQAVVMGVSPSGEMVMDTSVDGSNPDPNDDGIPDEMDSTVIAFPAIAVVKQVSTTSPPTLLPNGFYEITFDFIVANVGLDTLTNINLYDDFQNQFGCVYKDNVSNPIVSDPFGIMGTLPTSAAEGFTGTIPADNMLNGDGLLVPGDSFMVTVTLEIDPDCDGAPDTLLNQARGEAFDEDGEFVTDLSDSTDVVGDDPTLIDIPALGVSKGIVSIEEVDPAIAGEDGIFDVTYLVQVQNTGNVQLTDVMLEDEIIAQLAPAADSAFIVSGSLTGDAVDNGMENTGFDGTGDILIFDGAIMDPGQVIAVNIVARVDASEIPWPDTIENSAIATGTDGSGMMVMDSSEVGFNPDGSDDDGDGSVNTPTPLVPIPSIAIQKDQSLCEDAGEANDGNVLVGLDFIIFNNGSAPLEQIQIEDNLSANMNFGDALFGIVSNDSVVYCMANAADSVGMAPNANLNYDGIPDDIFILDGFSGLLFPEIA